MVALSLGACSAGPVEPGDGSLVEAPGAAGPAPGAASPDAVETAELERTWRAARVRVPDGAGGIVAASVDELESGAVVPGAARHGTDGPGRWPVVVWMHGCAGHWDGTDERLDWLATNGFVAIAPSSLARDFYPPSCDLAARRSGLYRPTLRMRQRDAGHAIRRARAFEWADGDNVFLAGLSEGAAVATTYVDPDPPAGRLRARVAESWGCHSGWAEYAGIGAPAGEAVLSLVADRDPWYTAPWHRGDCGDVHDGGRRQPVLRRRLRAGAARARAAAPARGAGDRDELPADAGGSGAIGRGAVSSTNRPGIIQDNPV